MKKFLFAATLALGMVTHLTPALSIAPADADTPTFTDIFYKWRLTNTTPVVSTAATEHDALLEITCGIRLMSRLLPTVTTMHRTPSDLKTFVADKDQFAQAVVANMTPLEKSLLLVLIKSSHINSSKQVEEKLNKAMDDFLKRPSPAPHGFVDYVSSYLPTATLSAAGYLARTYPEALMTNVVLPVGSMVAHYFGNDVASAALVAIPTIYKSARSVFFVRDTLDFMHKALADKPSSAKAQQSSVPWFLLTGLAVDSVYRLAGGTGTLIPNFAVLTPHLEKTWDMVSKMGSSLALPETLTTSSIGQTSKAFIARLHNALLQAWA